MLHEILFDSIVFYFNLLVVEELHQMNFCLLSILIVNEQIVVTTPTFVGCPVNSVKYESHKLKIERSLIVHLLCHVSIIKLSLEHVILDN